ncbi:MAG: co-chaperone GroES [Candidatus Poribacteria bacterium]|nr:co-chaperone GroES [Candidatus Poribacteria bacterium]
MALKPLSDHVVVEAQEEKETKIGSIIVPDTAKEKPTVGKVIAVGPGRVKDDGTRNPLTVKAGDTVIYSKYGGTDFELEGEEYLVLRESDILAIVG